MKLTSTLLAAGVAALAIGGIAGAQIIRTHMLTVQLPDGGIEHIVYTGETPPKVVFAPVAAQLPIFWPEPLDVDEAPFAMMRQVSVEMDRLSAGLFDEAATPGDAELPSGISGYSVASTVSGDGVCVRAVEITSTGQGQPRIVSRTSDHCGGAADADTAHAADAVRAPLPGLTQASYVTQQDRQRQVGS
jgi:hypothetical protein